MMLTREKARITSNEMAKRLKVSRHTITNYERSRTEPNQATIEKWANETNYSVDWILTGQIRQVSAAKGLDRATLAEMLVAALMGDKPTGLSLDELYLRPEEPDWVVPDYIDLTAEPPRVVQMIDAA